MDSLEIKAKIEQIKEITASYNLELAKLQKELNSAISAYTKALESEKITQIRKGLS